MSGARWPWRVRLLCAVLAGALAVVMALAAGGAAAAQIESEQAFGFTTTARVEAQVNPQGADTTCQLQYLSEVDFEHAGGWSAASTVPCSPGDLGAGVQASTAVVELSGLSLNSVYEYRFLASSGGNTIVGASQTFTTFGLEKFSFKMTEKDGRPYTEAGGHPYELTTRMTLNVNSTSTGSPTPDATVKDLSVELPPGLIGNPDAVPKCPLRIAEEEKCPGDTQIGTIWIGTVDEHENTGPAEAPLFNLVPPKGVAARFGMKHDFVNVYLDALVRSGSDYGVNVGTLNVTSFAAVRYITVTMWGVPAAAAHNQYRSCGERDTRGCASDVSPRPFLREPTSCAGSLMATAVLDSYQEPGSLVSDEYGLPALSGCEDPGFEPSIEAVPTSSVADSPTGLNVDLHFAQDENPDEASNADLRDASVTFPEGVTIDPSAADGLAGCSEAQVGFTGFKELNPVVEPGVSTAQFTPGPAQCPDASKLGTVQIYTPLLEHPMPGGMYLARQGENPFGSMLAVYLAVYDPISGVVVKLPGQVQADPVTGRLTATFDQNPQLPFEDLKVDLFGGSRAVFTTPAVCGSYATSSTLTPWSGNGVATPSSHPFVVSEAPGGGACAHSEAEQPDQPGFEAGMASPVAGSYSPFVLSLSREDGSQRFAGVDVTLPAGLIARVAAVEECPQAAIEAAQARGGQGQGALELASPSCPAGSEIGVVHVGVGSGSPFYVTGKAYFAGPYEGAPFSLVFVTPAVAGPLDLGTVVVRAALFVDPLTSQVTVKSDPLPSILDGIPLDIRSIDVDVERPGFTLNPTSCQPTAITGQSTSLAGQDASLSERFQAAGCTNMPFKPSFQVAASGKVSHLDGTSVSFKLSYPEGALGKEAWLRSAKFEFPKQLSARLPTIQKSCPAVTFQANPAGCPAAALIGTATVKTQLLPVPLAGPVYFVSYGGQKFPEAVFVLQGDGVTIDLHSETYIGEKTGVTSATLPAIPGVPFEEATVTLPAGPYSEFTGIGNLCKPTQTITTKHKVTTTVNGHRKRVTRTTKETVPAPLYMSTILTGQNGASISQDTPVAITECATKAGAMKKHRSKKDHKRAAKHGARKHAAGSNGGHSKAGR